MLSGREKKLDDIFSRLDYSVIDGQLDENWPMVNALILLIAPIALRIKTLIFFDTLHTIDNLDQKRVTVATSKCA